MVINPGINKVDKTILQAITVILITTILIYLEHINLAFDKIFLLNMLLLSYPHTIAGFIRDDVIKKEKLRIPFLFLIFTITLSTLYKYTDLTVLYNIYFYYQLYHYHGQNYGVMNSAQTDNGTRGLFRFLLYLSTLSNLLLVSQNTRFHFFGRSIYFPVDPILLENHYLMISVILSTIFIILIFFIRSKNRLGKDLSKSLVIHHLVFAAAFHWINNPIIGWLSLNILHNLQYLCFNWSYRSKRKMKFASHPVAFHALLILLSIVVISLLKLSAQKLPYILPWAFILGLSLNFTHYHLDSIIWKRSYPN